jgi:hypothetical protein
MTFKTAFQVCSIGLGVALMAACASQPANPTPPAATATAPAGAASAPAANEADTAAGIEKRFQDAARSYKIVQKDGKTLYCKREKVIGSTIPTMNCLSEAQLRTQVENMEDYRNRARNSSRCTHGAGCGAGG